MNPIQQAPPTSASLPLFSGDIFLEHYYQLIKKAEDVRRLQRLSKEQKWTTTFEWNDMLLKKDKVIIVTTVKQSIIFATRNLIALNGYTPEEVIGQKPSLFQGKHTDQKSKVFIRQAIHELRPFSVSILNYHKSGATYYCKIEGVPIFNTQGKATNFIAFESLES